MNGAHSGREGGIAHCQQGCLSLPPTFSWQSKCQSHEGFKNLERSRQISAPNGSKRQVHFERRHNNAAGTRRAFSNVFESVEREGPEESNLG